jgi:hypothetical protein
MAAAPLDAAQISALAALANGIIPADAIDAGAASVNAAARLAEKVAAGLNAALYLRGLETAERLAREHFATAVSDLNPRQIHELVAAVRDALPPFFKQLRMDVSALYLSDPAVWQRIGFPGPSSESGGYPDFDHPQVRLRIKPKRDE